MSENERQSPANVVINDKLQGTVVIFLRRGGLSTTKFLKKRLLLSPSVIVFQIREYLVQLQAKGLTVSCTFFVF